MKNWEHCKTRNFPTTARLGQIQLDGERVSMARHPLLSQACPLHKRKFWHPDSLFGESIKYPPFLKFHSCVLHTLSNQFSNVLKHLRWSAFPLGIPVIITTESSYGKNVRHNTRTTLLPLNLQHPKRNIMLLQLYINMISADCAKL